MKLIVALILALFTAVTPALGATNPNASLRTDRYRRYVFMTFTNLQNVSRVNYVLVYDTNSGQKGVEGGFKTTGKSRTATRRQILGTCSSGKCVFHQGVRNLQLDTTFTLRSGGTVNVSRTLP